MTELPSWHPLKNGNSGAFKAGHKIGRPQGVKDRLSSDLKKDFLEALRSFGSDSQGTGGFEGFVHYAIRHNLSGVLKVVAKIIPLQVNGDFQGKHIANVIINAVPPNQYVKTDGVVIDGKLISDETETPRQTSQFSSGR